MFSDLTAYVALWSCLCLSVFSDMQTYTKLHMVVGIMLQNWQSEQENRKTIAVSAGNKAFIHWTSTGVEKKQGLTNHMYGLELLVFDEQCMISEILVLRQPLESQKAELFGKEE